MMTRDNKILMPKELTAENGAKYYFNGEFKVSVEHKCDCDNGYTSNPDCDICEGYGVYDQPFVLDWSTIKEIYKTIAEKMGEEV